MCVSYNDKISRQPASTINAPTLDEPCVRREASGRWLMRPNPGLGPPSTLAFVGLVTTNPYKTAFPDKDSVQGHSDDQHAGVFTRCLQLGLLLTAGTCSVAVVWFLVWSRAITDPAQANIGAGLAALVVPPSLVAFGSSIASWRATTARGRITLSLFAAILLLPSLLLFLLIKL
jgi:hypothetical protein